MEVRNCKSCGRLYNYIGGTYKNLCPECVSKMEDKFAEVKEYIENNIVATMPQISKDCDVRMEQIERWVREERLFFSEDSPIGIDCESCGVTIKSGRYCPACKNKMTNVLSDLYNSDSNRSKRDKSENEKERTKFLSREFIDKVNKQK